MAPVFLFAIAVGLASAAINAAIGEFPACLTSVAYALMSFVAHRQQRRLDE